MSLWQGEEMPPPPNYDIAELTAEYRKTFAYVKRLDSKVDTLDDRVRNLTTPADPAALAAYAQAGSWLQMVNTITWTLTSIFLVGAIIALNGASQNPDVYWRLAVCLLVIILCIAWGAVDYVYSKSAWKAREKLRRLEGRWVEDHKFYCDQDDELSVKRRKRVTFCVYVPVVTMGVLAIFLAVSTVLAMTAKKAEIEAANAKWIELFNRGDFAGVGSLYTVNATALPPGSGMVRGDAAIGAMWKSIAEQVGDPNLMTLEVKSLGPSTAQEIGTYSLRTKGPNPKAVTGKYLVVWEKIGNDWKLAADIWNDGQ